MPFAKAADDTRLYYKDWGRGRPVVLIHGWPLTADSFDDVAFALAENGFRAISYDRRGFGRSDQPWNGYDYDTFAQDLETVIDECGVRDDVALVGFSMGGGEVARYLTRNGGRGVRQAVLISAVVPYMLQSDDNPDGVQQAQFDAMTQGMKEDRAAFFQSFFKDFFGVGMVSHPVSEAVIDNAWRQAMMAGLRPTLAAAQAFATADFRPDLAAFTMPTLLIHGTADKTVPIDATARAVARAVPHARLIEYDGSAHGVFESDKERLIGDLVAFLGTQSGADTGFEIDTSEAAFFTN
ncbi:MAG: hypothetical protein QOJ91_2256 [Sphingomonadales bacterium]|jgi:pimeloyl-ACP methyl ester carboxylesterase|nr:hypothetical protein [Sphingomonadales bacterium]